MFHYTVDAFQPVDGCQKCCCERFNFKPGTTNKVVVGYAPWAAPIGDLHCQPQFALELLDTCPTPSSGNGAPAQTDAAAFTTTVGGTLNGDLKTKITDPEDDPLKFELMPFYGTTRGKLALNPDGTFVYTPQPGYSGADRFFYTADDGNGHKVAFEALIGVGVAANTVVATPHVSVGSSNIDPRIFAVSFAVTIAPHTPQCEVWRLTVLQGALDCDCTCFTRTDCFDIGIARC